MPDFSFGIIFILLYGISALIGKFVKLKIEKIFLASVLSIIFTVSFWGGTVIRDLFTLVNVLLISISYSLITLIITYILGNLVSRTITINKSSLLFDKTPLYFLIILAIGWIAGITINITLPFDSIISYELYILGILVGLLTGSELSIKLIKNSGINSLIAIFNSILGSILAGFLASFIFSIDLRTSLGITMGMGWYSFAGPVVAFYSSPFYGTIAFLANFFREQLTIASVPFLKGSNISLISLGGATTMDDTLPVLVARLGKQNMIVYMVNGLVLTIIVAIVLPLIFLI